MKNSAMRFLQAVCPALLLAGTLTADTLILRDGRRIPGQLISVYNNVIEFAETGPFGGVRTFRIDRRDVLGLEFDRSDRNAPSFPPPAGSRSGRASGLRERQVLVAADAPWTDTNINVQAGQEVYFQAGGEVRWGPGRRDGPGGEENSPMNPNRPIPSRPAAALIGRVGEGSTDYFYVGASRGPIRMRSAGRLFLGVNDDYLQDNSGAFRVIVYY